MKTSTLTSLLTSLVLLLGACDTGTMALSGQGVQSPGTSAGGGAGTPGTSGSGTSPGSTPQPSPESGGGSSSSSGGTSDGAATQAKLQLTVAGAVTSLAQTPTADFGVVPYQSQKTLVVVLKNLGNATLTLDLGGVLDRFVVANDTGSVSLAKNQTRTIAYKAKSDLIGDNLEQVLIHSNDPSYPEVTLNLKSSIAMAQLLVKYLDQIRLSDDPSGTLDFGTCTVGETGESKVVSLESGGGLPLSISSIALPAGFRFSPAVKFPLSIGVLGAAKELTIQQLCTTPGEFGATPALINSNDSLSPIFKLRLHSIVQDIPRWAEISVFRNLSPGLSPIANAQPDVIAFDNANQNGAEPTETFTIKNPGTGPLLLNGIKVPAGFYLVAPLSFVAANGQATFQVKRTTTSSGIFTGSIEIDSNAAQNSVFTFPISAVVSLMPFVCNPFGGAKGSDQILSQLYAGSKALNGSVNNFFARDSKGDEIYKLNALLCFNNLNVPERDFSEGFGTNTNTYLTKPGTNTKLIEWFAIKTASNLKLGHEAPGYYQIATVSDDGSIVRIDGTTIVSNDGTHSQQMRCATTAVDLRDPASRRAIRVDYYQGPATEIALVLMWRKVDPTKPSTLKDELCNAGSFRKDAAKYNALFSRGWKPIPATSFELSSDLLDRLK